MKKDQDNSADWIDSLQMKIQLKGDPSEAQYLEKPFPCLQLFQQWHDTCRSIT